MKEAECYLGANSGFDPGGPEYHKKSKNRSVT